MPSLTVKYTADTAFGGLTLAGSKTYSIDLPLAQNIHIDDAYGTFTFSASVFSAYGTNTRFLAAHILADGSVRYAAAALNGQYRILHDADENGPYSGPTGPDHPKTAHMCEILQFSDHFRTYDVAKPFDDVATYCRANGLLKRADLSGMRHGAKGSVNIESRLLVAVGLGFNLSVFGYYHSLTLEFPTDIPQNATVWTQCLLDDTAVNVTDFVMIENNRLTVDGLLLRKLGHKAGERPTTTNLR